MTEAYYKLTHALVLNKIDLINFSNECLFVFKFSVFILTLTRLQRGGGCCDATGSLGKFEVVIR